MSSKPESVNMTVDELAKQWYTLRAECDRLGKVEGQLLAENKRLRQLRDSDLETTARVITDLRAENERLRSLIVGLLHADEDAIEQARALVQPNL